MTTQATRGAIAGAISERINTRRFAPTTPRTNADRAKEAEILADAFHAMTGVDPDPGADGPATALGDILAHLMHYADAKGVDFEDCLRRAYGYYGDECKEEQT